MENDSTNEPQLNIFKQKREREANWSPAEKDLLFKITQDHHQIINSKRTDGEMCARKNRTWHLITEELKAKGYNRELFRVREAYRRLKNVYQKSGPSTTDDEKCSPPEKKFKPRDNVVQQHSNGNTYSANNDNVVDFLSNLKLQKVSNETQHKNNLDKKLSDKSIVKDLLSKTTNGSVLKACDSNKENVNSVQTPSPIKTSLRPTWLSLTPQSANKSDTSSDIEAMLNNVSEENYDVIDPVGVTAKDKSKHFPDDQEQSFRMESQKLFLAKLERKIQLLDLEIAIKKNLLEYSKAKQGINLSVKKMKLRKDANINTYSDIETDSADESRQYI